MALQGTGSAVNGWSRPFYLTGASNYPITLSAWVKVPAHSLVPTSFFGLAGSNAIAHMLYGGALPSLATAAIYGSVGSLTDSGGHVWTIVSGQAFEDGSPPVFSSDVIVMALVGGVAWHLNAFGQWYSWSGTAWTAQYVSPLNQLFIDLYDDTALQANPYFNAPPGAQVAFISDGGWHHIGAQIITGASPPAGGLGGIFWIDGVRSVASTAAGFNLGAQTFTSLQIGVAPSDGSEPVFDTGAALAEVCVFGNGPTAAMMDQTMIALAQGVNPLRTPGKRALKAYHPLRGNFQDFGSQHVGFSPLGTPVAPVWVNHPPVDAPLLAFRKLQVTHLAAVLAGTSASTDVGQGVLSTSIAVVGTGASTDSATANLLASGLRGVTQVSSNSGIGALTAATHLIGTGSSADVGLAAFSSTGIVLQTAGLAVSNDAGVGSLTIPSVAANAQQLQNALVDSIMRGQPFLPPSTWFVALVSQLGDQMTAGQELSGGGYARVAVSASLSAWSGTQGPGTTAASIGLSGLVSNNAAIVFPTATADWATAVGYEFWDAPAGGNRWFSGKLGASLTILNGQTRRFPAASLSVAIG